MRFCISKELPGAASGMTEREAQSDRGAQRGLVNRNLLVALGWTHICSLVSAALSPAPTHPHSGLAATRRERNFRPFAPRVLPEKLCLGKMVPLE